MPEIKIEISGKKPKTFEINFPDSWNDLNDEQFIVCANHYLNANYKYEANIILLKYFFNVPDQDFVLINETQLIQLIPLLDFILTPPAASSKIYIKTLDGFAATDIDNLTFRQYIDLEFYFLEYKKNWLVADFEKMAACIYPGFNSFKETDPELLSAIFWNVETFLSFIYASFPQVFKPKKQKAPKKNEPPKHLDPFKYGWDSTVRFMAKEDNPFGRDIDILNRAAVMVLAHFEESILMSEQLKKKQALGLK